ncbi:MAG: histidine kinase N-terminal 7TM domain-containing protein, partial [bacterium]
MAKETLEFFILSCLLIFTFIDFVILLLVISSKRLSISLPFIVFLIFCIEWLLSNYLSYIAKTPFWALFWMRETSAGPIIMAAAIVWLGYTFNEENDFKLSLVKKICIWGPPLILVLLTPTRLNMISRDAGFWSDWKPGILFDLFSVYGFLYIFVWAPIVFYKKLKEAKTRALKKQIEFIFAGMFFFAAIGILFSEVIMPTFFNVQIFSYLSSVTTIFFIIPCAYAILRYKLFSVKVVATEIFAAILVVLSFINFYRVYTQVGLAGSYFNLSIFILVSIVSVFFIRSAIKEMRDKERIAQLASNLESANASLKNLNEHLEEKVAEQTIEIRKAYEVEKKARHDLEELDKAKTDFMLTTQHHLRTPLTIVKAVANMLVGKKEGDVYTKTDTAFIEKL